jgi:ribosomal protein L2
LCLKNSKIGLVLFAIQSYKDKQAKLARSAGCYSKILKISDGKVFLQMPSLKIYVISDLCSATLGLSSKRNL